MANALKGKSTVFLISIAPNEDAAETVRGFFENHYEFMREKSHREEPLKLLQYSVSESPEWKNDGILLRVLLHFLKENFLKKLGEQSLSCLRFMKMKMVFTIILSNPRTLLQKLTV